MSKKAKEAALKAYPKEIKVAYGPLPGADGPCKFDDNLPYRIGYQKGYKQAEKDLALTGEDMRLAFKAVNDALDNCEGKTRAEVLEDALQRFNEQREKK